MRHVKDKQLVRGTLTREWRFVAHGRLQAIEAGAEIDLTQNREAVSAISHYFECRTNLQFIN
jgi:hypothetical protein